ncbi:uncharacterized protein SOCE26_086310 [Sorangium cellulosum]|uniref:SH3b domain-containing protein n=1 Tax=Sorangium cellulosum TaxID=56 RepID=A0A2L0F6Q5_SORCE|nr:hypothetical protein [Sorangium cellulosum]AUX47119.1 uncharacterized protein SOCE26_086310 [Sorangium cellulosum]
MARTVEMWSLVLAGSLFAGAGCNREEPSTNAAAADAAPVAAPATADLPAGYVATYPTMTPQPGSRRLQQAFPVYQSADIASKELARLDNGAIVELKASYQDWMLVAFQNAGQPTLGWIQLKVNDPRASVATDADVRTATAGAKPATGAGTTAGNDAGAGTTAGNDAGAGTTAGNDAGTTAGNDAGAGTTAGNDAGTTAGNDAGAGDGGAPRPRIDLKKILEKKK